MTGSHRSWFSEFRKEIAWTAVVLLLAALAVVALWPRGPASDGSPVAAAPPPGSPSATDPALRRAASLAPCAPPSAPPGAVAALAGATGTCMADGSPTNLGAATAGPALVNVWASWCGPCRVELPVLQEYSRQPGALRVVGVQVDSAESDGLDLFRLLGVHVPSVHDDTGRIGAALKVPYALPASYVITATGEVRRIDPPVVFRSPDEVRSAIERTVGAPR